MKQTAVYRLLLVLSILFNVGLLVAVVLLVLREQPLPDPPPTRRPCPDNVKVKDQLERFLCGDLETTLGREESSEGTDRKTHNSKNSAKRKKTYENVFEDLTRDEINAVLDYMYSLKDLHLVSPDLVNLTDNYILSVELYLPNKAETLTFLSGQGPRPVRQAKVVTLEPQATPPRVMEYVVTPLPRPTHHFPNPRRAALGDYRVRPFSGAELRATVTLLQRYMQPQVEDMLHKLFGANFIDCRERCMTFTAAPLNTASSKKRSLWIAAMHQVDFPTLYPVSLQLLLQTDGLDLDKWHVAKVWFANQTFPSLDAIVDQHNKGKLSLGSSPSARSSVDEGFFLGDLSSRGVPFPSRPQAGPRQYQPQGNRFSMKGQRVTYLQWEFSWRMSVVTGIQLFDVQHMGQRVVYELSLQEVATLYSGADPLSAFSQLLDSAYCIGNRAHGLMPGVDCPEYAVFLNTLLYSEDFLEPQTYPKAVCIFEHNTQKPLRRHKSNSHRSGFFYGGLVDSVLVLRTALTLFNYDYLVDIVFHNNGVLEVTVSMSGYLLTSFYTKEEEAFGFRLRDAMLGNLHQHLVHFKVDLDVLGVENRYETLDLYVENQTWPWFEQRTPYFQPAMRRTLLRTEKEAAVRNDVTTPKYHVVYNQRSQNQQGNPRGYRLHNRTPVRQLLPEKFGAENSVSWSRYPIAVTRRKETEEASSSRHAQFDSANPVVDFKSFFEDNESIVDEDLVAWVTLGVYHIPHAEDLPNVATAAKDMTFALLPFNYFDEDPSMASRDAVSVDVVFQAPEAGRLKIERNGMASSFQCVPQQYDFDTFQNSTASLFFGLE